MRVVSQLIGAFRSAGCNPLNPQPVRTLNPLKWVAERLAAKTEVKTIKSPEDYCFAPMEEDDEMYSSPTWKNFREELKKIK